MSARPELVAPPEARGVNWSPAQPTAAARSLTPLLTPSAPAAFFCQVFYNDEEARKYTSNSHMIETQERLTERALELLALPDDGPKLLLDLGCGSGLSGEALTAGGHHWRALLGRAHWRPAAGL